MMHGKLDFYSAFPASDHTNIYQGMIYSLTVGIISNPLDNVALLPLT